MKTKFNLNEIEVAIKDIKHLKALKATNKEIEIFMKTPFKVLDNNVLDDGTHRCCSMIGRLIRNEEYINMYIIK